MEFDGDCVFVDSVAAIQKAQATKRQIIVILHDEAPVSKRLLSTVFASQKLADELIQKYIVLALRAKTLDAANFAAVYPVAIPGYLSEEQFTKLVAELLPSPVADSAVALPAAPVQAVPNLPAAGDEQRGSEAAARSGEAAAVHTEQGGTQIVGPSTPIEPARTQTIADPPVLKEKGPETPGIWGSPEQTAAKDVARTPKLMLEKFWESPTPHYVAKRYEAFSAMLRRRSGHRPAAEVLDRVIEIHKQQTDEKGDSDQVEDLVLESSEAEDGPEPASAELALQLRGPHGAVIQYSLPSSMSWGEAEDLLKKKFYEGRDISVSTGFPPRSLDAACWDQTLSEIGLASRSVLSVAYKGSGFQPPPLPTESEGIRNEPSEHTTPPQRVSAVGAALASLAGRLKPLRPGSGEKDFPKGKEVKSKWQYEPNTQLEEEIRKFGRGETGGGGQFVAGAKETTAPTVRRRNRDNVARLGDYVDDSDKREKFFGGDSTVFYKDDKK